jgi:hypothetical protein
MAVVLTSTVIQTKVLGTKENLYLAGTREMEPVLIKVPLLVLMYQAP